MFIDTTCRENGASMKVYDEELRPACYLQQKNYFLHQGLC